MPADDELLAADGVKTCEIDSYKALLTLVGVAGANADHAVLEQSMTESRRPA